MSMDPLSAVLYSRLMPLDPPPEPSTMPPLVYDAAVFSKLFDNLRDSIRDYSYLLSESFEKTSDFNKQLAAFYERLMLIDLGTIGLSVTALTSIGSKVATMGWRKWVIAALVSVAWTFLLLSAFACRQIMHQLLAANRKLYQGWVTSAFERNMENVSTDVSRLSVGMRGTIPREDGPIDSTVFFNGLASELRDKYGAATKAQRDEADKAIAAESLLIGEAAGGAIRLMQLALVLLALCAMFLVLSF